MPIDRRQVLFLIAGAPGAVIAGNDAIPSPSPESSAQGPSGDARSVPSASVAGPPTEKVLGIGGLFFRATDPKILAQWYFENLGIALMASGPEGVPWHTEAGVTVFAPFARDTKYFGALTQAW